MSSNYGRGVHLSNGGLQRRAPRCRIAHPAPAAPPTLFFLGDLIGRHIPLHTPIFQIEARTILPPNSVLPATGEGQAKLSQSRSVASLSHQDRISSRSPIFDVQR